MLDRKLEDKLVNHRIEIRPFFLPVDGTILNGNTERPSIFQWSILVMDSTLPAKGTAHRASRGTEKVGFSNFRLESWDKSFEQKVVFESWNQSFIASIRWTRPQSTSFARAGCGLLSAVPWRFRSKSRNSSCQAFSQAKSTPAPKEGETIQTYKKQPNGWVDVMSLVESLMTC